MPSIPDYVLTFLSTACLWFWSDSAIDCPICLTSTLESGQRGIRIDVPSCKHTFCLDCLAKYMSTNYICPICRTRWFDPPPAPDSPASGGDLLPTFRINIRSREEALRECELLLQNFDLGGGKVRRRRPQAEWDARHVPSVEERLGLRVTISTREEAWSVFDYLLRTYGLAREWGSGRRDPLENDCGPGV